MPSIIKLLTWGAIESVGIIEGNVKYPLLKFNGRSHRSYFRRESAYVVLRRKIEMEI
jgi:hypothetical protein